MRNRRCVWVWVGSGFRVTCYELRVTRHRRPNKVEQLRVTSYELRATEGRTKLNSSGLRVTSYELRATEGRTKLNISGLRITHYALRITLPQLWHTQRFTANLRFSGNARRAHARSANSHGNQRFHNLARSRGFSRVWTMRVERADPPEGSTPTGQPAYLELLTSGAESRL